jgi:hypothetical protein
MKMVPSYLYSEFFETCMMRSSGFNERVIISFLPESEMLTVMNSDQSFHNFLGGACFLEQKIIVLLRGNKSSIRVPFKAFTPNAIDSPDFTKFEIIDWGSAIGLGRYDASSTSILSLMDPDFRKWRLDTCYGAPDKESIIKTISFYEADYNALKAELLV